MKPGDKVATLTSVYADNIDGVSLAPGSVGYVCEVLPPEKDGMFPQVRVLFVSAEVKTIPPQAELPWGYDKTVLFHGRPVPSSYLSVLDTDEKSLAGMYAALYSTVHSATEKKYRAESEVETLKRELARFSRSFDEADAATKSLNARVLNAEAALRALQSKRKGKKK